jgi:hypothetical protein
MGMLVPIDRPMRTSRERREQGDPLPPVEDEGDRVGDSVLRSAIEKDGARGGNMIHLHEDGSVFGEDQGAPQGHAAPFHLAPFLRQRSYRFQILRRQAVETSVPCAEEDLRPGLSAVNEGWSENRRAERESSEKGAVPSKGI